MRILFVLYERNLGGGSKSSLNLMEELRKEGHEIFAVVPFRSGKLYKSLKEKGFSVTCIFYGWWMMPSYWNRILQFAFRVLYVFEEIAVRRIARYAKKHRVELIHSGSSVVDTGARAAQRLDLPHVWHFREFGDKDFRLEYLKGKEKSAEFINRVKGKVIFISQCLRNYYQDLIAEEKGCLVYNGVSEEYCVSKEEDEGCDGPVRFLISGSLQANKRQDLAIQACRILRDRGLEDFHLYIAGQRTMMKESAIFEAELKDMAAADLKNHVTFLGWTNDMVSVRKNADVELMCSSSEAFGRTTVEAMLASNPVIASDAGANPELIIDGENGFLFEEGNAASLADCMERLINNKEQIRFMGQYAADYAKGRFLSCYYINNVKKIYKELLGE